MNKGKKCQFHAALQYRQMLGCSLSIQQNTQKDRRMSTTKTQPSKHIYPKKYTGLKQKTHENKSPLIYEYQAD